LGLFCPSQLAELRSFLSVSSAAGWAARKNFRFGWLGLLPDPKNSFSHIDKCPQWSKMKGRRFGKQRSIVCSDKFKILITY